MHLQIELEARLESEELEACDFSFLVREEALGPFDGTDIQAVVPVTAYRKSYEAVTCLEAAEGQALYVAREAGVLRGYVLVARAWNNYAQIEDIAVDRDARRLGVGSRLMQAALAWARTERLPGVRLETQANNVQACRFYAGLGFSLGGHDRFLYRALGSERAETALYWYLLFGDEGMSRSVD